MVTAARSGSRNAIVLEVAVESVDDAAAAERGGADRLELCAALDLGGLTPSIATVRRVAARGRLPVLVMIRPRPGGFSYNDAEIAVMSDDIAAAIAAGADGLVFGVLDADGNLDLAKMRSLRECCGDRTVVCHRAFDFVPDPSAALEQLIDLGVDRVLTAGQSADATGAAAAARISALREQAAGRIEVLPGGGVRPDNVVELMRRTGCDQVHGSFRLRRPDRSTRGGPPIDLGADFETGYGATDASAVALVRARLDQLGR